MNDLTDSCSRLGGGGLSQGIGKNPAINVKWAVEYSPSSVMTYEYEHLIAPCPRQLTNILLRKNHPHTVVYNQSSNELLEHAIQDAHGEDPPPLRRIGDKTSLPAMPKPGEVDGICAGKSCARL